MTLWSLRWFRLNHGPREVSGAPRILIIQGEARCLADRSIFLSFARPPLLKTLFLSIPPLSNPFQVVRQKLERPCCVAQGATNL